MQLFGIQLLSINYTVCEALSDTLVTTESPCGPSANTQKQTDTVKWS